MLHVTVFALSTLGPSFFLTLRTHLLLTIIMILLLSIITLLAFFLVATTPMQSALLGRRAGTLAVGVPVL